ncbi:uncharacterized protein LOC144667332 [Oculina patagonica]
MDLAVEVMEKLEKLTNLFRANETENCLLRTGIDLLAQRTKESMNELERHRSEIETALHNEIRKYSVLEEKFFVLQLNYEEIVKMKKEHETEIEKLGAENSQIRNENASLKDELKRVSEKLQSSQDQERIALEENEKLRTEERLTEKNCQPAPEQRERVALEKAEIGEEEKERGKEERGSDFEARKCDVGVTNEDVSSRILLMKGPYTTTRRIYTSFSSHCRPNVNLVEQSMKELEAAGLGMYKQIKRLKIFYKILPSQDLRQKLAKFEVTQEEYREAFLMEDEKLTKGNIVTINEGHPFTEELNSFLTESQFDS